MYHSQYEVNKFFASLFLPNQTWTLLTPSPINVQWTLSMMVNMMTAHNTKDFINRKLMWVKGMLNNLKNYFS